MSRVAISYYNLHIKEGIERYNHKYDDVMVGKASVSERFGLRQNNVCFSV